MAGVLRHHSIPTSSIIASGTIALVYCIILYSCDIPTGIQTSFIKKPVQLSKAVCQRTGLRFYGQKRRFPFARSYDMTRHAVMATVTTLGCAAHDAVGCCQILPESRACWLVSPLNRIDALSSALSAVVEAVDPDVRASARRRPPAHGRRGRRRRTALVLYAVPNPFVKQREAASGPQQGAQAGGCATRRVQQQRQRRCGPGVCHLVLF